MQAPLRTALVCFLVNFVPIVLHCQAAPPFSIATSTSVGVLYGQAYEEIYNQDVATNYKNSELIWPFEPLVYAGASLSLDTSIGAFATLGLRQALDGKSGTMTDSDFLNGDGVRTHYSQSDSYTERAILLDFKAGYKAALSGPIKLGAYIGFSYMDFKWSARDVYLQYPTSGTGYTDTGGIIQNTDPFPAWSANETKTPIYGTGILTEQAYLFGTVGIEGSYRVLAPLTLGLSFSFSPIASCYYEDNHELRMVDFYSTMKGGYMLEPVITAEYSIKPGASLKLALAYRSAFGFIGAITQVNQGTTSTSSGGNYYAGPDSAITSADASGASISMLDASLAFRLAF